MYGGAGATGTNVAASTVGGFSSKFTSNFGNTLLKSMAQKENGVSASQAFPTGFARYIGDG
jgi:hypothetical protein